MAGERETRHPFPFAIAPLNVKTYRWVYLAASDATTRTECERPESMFGRSAAVFPFSDGVYPGTAAVLPNSRGLFHDTAAVLPNTGPVSSNTWHVSPNTALVSPYTTLVLVNTRRVLTNMLQPIEKHGLC